MLVSPDSSINNTQMKMSSHSSAIVTISSQSHHMQPQRTQEHSAQPLHLMNHNRPPSAVRVQVQECSQSQSQLPPPSAPLSLHHRSAMQHHTAIVSSLESKPTSAPVSTITSGPNVLARERYGMIGGGGPEPSSAIIHHHQQRVSMPENNVIYKVSSRPMTPDYTKSYPVMDTTVASSVKGEPELNIGNELTHSHLPISSAAVRRLSLSCLCLFSSFHSLLRPV